MIRGTLWLLLVGCPIAALVVAAQTETVNGAVVLLFIVAVLSMVALLLIDGQAKARR